MLQLQSAFGVLALLVLAWKFGENRGAVSLRQAPVGLIVTFVTAVVLIKLPIVAHASIVSGTLSTCLMGAILGMIT